MRTIPTASDSEINTPMTTSSLAPTATATVSYASSAQHSAWRYPIPYLFGGLAAMLGLIAFALLVLACSYWKLLAQWETTQEGDGERDLEKGEGDSESAKNESPKDVREEKILVIMAGDEKPTFLATPASFGHEKDEICEKSEQKEMDKDNDHVQATIPPTTPQEQSPVAVTNLAT